jgi:hypothetical protein
MTESEETEMIRGISARTWTVLNDRLEKDSPGVADEYRLVGITIKLYQESVLGDSQDVGKTYAIAVHRHFVGVPDGEQEEEAIWSFGLGGIVQKTGAWVKRSGIDRYGDDKARKKDATLLPIFPHNVSDAIILLDLAMDPNRKIAEAARLSYINGQTKRLKIGSPRRSGRSRL